MDYYFLSSLVLSALGIIFISKKSIKNKNQEEMVFKENFENFNLPACVVDSKGEVIWYNNAVSHHFPEKAKLKKSFSYLFHPQKILGHVEVSHKEKSWVLNHISFNNSFGIIFAPTKPLDLQWWADIPYPIGTVNEAGELESANNAFKEILNDDFKNKNIKKWAPKFSLKKASLKNGQEVLWHSDESTTPMLAWVKDYGSKKVILLENRSEFIKLRNQAQEAQHLQTLGQLSGGIIHDFNNLLTAIRGFTDLLEDTIPENEMIEEIKRNTEQASNLAKELLHFVKIKPSEEQNSNPKEFLKKIMTMMIKLMGEKITVEFEANSNENVALSETQLEQIILNMGINAKDAMPDGGKLKISINEEEVSKEKAKKSKSLSSGKYVVLEVKDSGSGISKENITKIFSPFFSTKAKGTGLGLASCMRIVHHISGSIEVNSTKKGSTFKIYLPALKAEKKVIKSEKKALKDKVEVKSNKKIVLVEDEESIRNLGEKVLIKAGYEVLSFANGEDALNCIKKIKVDGLITDAVLPGLDGIKLVNEVQKMFPDLPILMVSGYSIEDIENHIPESINFMPKPFTLKNLVEKASSLF